MTLTAIIAYGILMFVAGFIASLVHEQYKRDRIKELHDEAGKADERIVCRNATVVFDGREISWYDNNKKVRNIIVRGKHK